MTEQEKQWERERLAAVKAGKGGEWFLKYLHRLVTQADRAEMIAHERQAEAHALRAYGGPDY